MENQTNEYYTIDLAHIFKALLNKVWVIALSGFLAAVLGCSIAAFVITPTYSSSIMLYVDNTNTAEGTKLTISSSEMAAAQDLAKTYGEILNARTTLEKVIEDTGVTYTYRELAKKIVAAPANDTEIIKVTVTTSSPEKSADIANSIARVLPERVYEINKKHMVPVDYAIPEYDKVAPSITMYTFVGQQNHSSTMFQTLQVLSARWLRRTKHTRSRWRRLLKRRLLHLRVHSRAWQSR